MKTFLIIPTFPHKKVFNKYFYRFINNFAVMYNADDKRVSVKINKVGDSGEGFDVVIPNNLKSLIIVTIWIILLDFRIDLLDNVDFLSIILHNRKNDRTFAAN